MFEYFNRKIAYKIIRRSVIALALFILFTNFVILYDPLTGVGGLLYKLYLIAAFVCIVEAIWVFFNLRFEIVSRFILTLLIGLCFISYGLPIIAPDQDLIYIVIFEIVLLISIIYYIKEHKYENITLSNIEDTILKIDYQFYILILLILLCISPYFFISENPHAPNRGEVTFNEASSQINNKTDVMVTVDSMNNSDYMIVKSANEDHIVYTYWTDSRPNQVDYAPDVSSNAASAVYQYRSATLISSGDNAIIQNLEKGDTVLVFGGVYGREKLIREYKIK